MSMERPIIAASAADTPGADECPLVPPVGYLTEIGYGRGNETRALRQARAEAEAKAIARYTDGLPEAHKLIVSQHVLAWESRYEGRHACALAAIDKQYVGVYEAEAAALEASLDALTAAVAERAAGRPIEIAPPTWIQSGCISSLGWDLAQRLKNRLANYPDVQLVTAGQEDLSSVLLQLQLSHTPGQVTVAAELFEPNLLSTPMPGFSTLDTVLNVQGEENTCADVAETARTETAIALDVVMDTDVGFLCEGELFYPTLRLGSEARVRLFSVSPDGATYAWPSLTDGDRFAAGDHSLGENAAIWAADGDEQIVAVAVSPGKSMGVFEEYDQLCRLDGGLAPHLTDPALTIAKTSFVIWPAGSDGCAQSSTLEDRAEANNAALARLPTCGR